MIDWADLLGKVVIPALVGGVAGWFSPMINWEIEKRRQVLQRRRELVTGWRMELIPLVAKLPQDGWSAADGDTLFSSPYYASLRPHLQPELVRQLEAERSISVGLNIRRVLAEEIGRIERKWKLV